MSVLQKKITLKCAPIVAFETFVFDMPKWWPMETHSVAASSGKLPANLIVERKTDGRIVEVDSEGDTHLWGHFQVYDAPHRVLIAWHVDEPPNLATYIEVVFGMETNGSTAVVLSHNGWGILGDEAEQRREAYDSDWDHVFANCFKSAAEEAAKEGAPVIAPATPMRKHSKKTDRAWLSSLTGAFNLAS